MRLFTSKEAREIDGRAIEELGIPGIVLMENAALGALKVIEDEMTLIKGKEILVIAGKGKNGGDGFAVARHLSNKGAIVKILLIGSLEEVLGDARINLEIALKMDIPIYELKDDTIPVDFLSFDLIIDAILGTGIKGVVRGHITQVINAINDSGKTVISLDLPSGLDPDTGRILGACIKAKKTVTFGVLKIGLFLYPGAEYAGSVHLADIGVPSQVLNFIGSKMNLTSKEEISSWLLTRSRTAHKGNFGHLLVVAGSPGMTGAAALTSLGSLRAGAGLVTLAVPAALQPIMAIKLTEVMTEALPQNTNGKLSYEALKPILNMTEKRNVLAIGPGLSQDPETVALVREVVARVSIPMVIDADGLNALVGSVEILKERKSKTIITPHPGEMARLCGVSVDDIQADRMGYALRFAKEWNVIVVLKGARTVIADEDGNVYINSTGNPGMASVGSGDVLTGVISGLLAQSIDPYRSAVIGVYLHGLAGDIGVKEKGEESLIAGDILRSLPKAFLNVY
jgi:hydroxyethylthiazole kinase-like uncharacterized protein yjeF